ncbi:MAG: MarR family transcriptional regulator [Thermoplasmata archaeon]
MRETTSANSMATLFGTLGWRPASLIPSIKSTEGLERVIFYHSDHERSKRARNEVVQYCNERNIPVRPVELRDAFDLIQIAKRIREDIRKERGEGNIIAKFNIGGGTRLMSSGALLACVLEGVPTTYVHDDTLAEFPLPLLQIEYSAALTPKQKEVLRALVEHNEPTTQTELSKTLGIHKATINHHIKELKRKGLVSVRTDPKDSRKKIVEAAPFIELLVE